MKKTVMFFACAVSFFSFSAQAALPSNAKLSLDKNNVKVWTYKDPNNSVLSYKSETIFDYPIEKAVALVLDVEHAPNWAPNITKVQLLNRDDHHGDFTIYMILHFPFPLKDRDMVVRGKIIKDINGNIVIKNKAITQGVALKSEYVRMTKYEGDWTFQKLGANRVKVTNSGYADPEGSVPASVANMFVEQMPYQMLQKMKAALAQNPKLPALPEILK